VPSLGSNCMDKRDHPPQHNTYEQTFLYNRLVWISTIAAASFILRQWLKKPSHQRGETREPAKLEKFVVTGSLIKRIEGESALPVQTFTMQEIDAQGMRVRSN